MIKNGLAQTPVLATDQDPSVLLSGAERHPQRRPQRRPWPPYATFAFVAGVNLVAWTGVIALGIVVL